MGIAICMSIWIHMYVCMYVYLRMERLVRRARQAGKAGRQGRRVSPLYWRAALRLARDDAIPSHYIISSVLRHSLVPFCPRASHSAAQLRSPLRRSLPQAQVFRRAPRPGAHKFNAKVKAATTRNRVGRECARYYSFVVEEERRRERFARCSVCVRCPSFRVRASRLFLNDSESKTRRVPLFFPFRSPSRCRQPIDAT